MANSYLAIQILRSHMQYAIEIGSNCNFQVSQGSVERNIFMVRWIILIMYIYKVSSGI